MNDRNGNYVVLVNNEGQHSLWPESKEVPNGWNRLAYTGSMNDCAAHVDEVWTDMRPVSIRGNANVADANLANANRANANLANANRANALN